MPRYFESTPTGLCPLIIIVGLLIDMEQIHAHHVKFRNKSSDWIP